MSCNVCAGWQAKKWTTNARGQPRRACDQCGTPIPVYPAMDGNGFVGHQLHHEHAEKHDLGNGTFKELRVPVHMELCYGCYKDDFKRVYPGKEPPDIANVRPPE